MVQKNRGRGFSILVLLVLIMAIWFMFDSMNRTDTKYSEIVELFTTDQVAEFSLNLGSGKLLYRLKSESGTAMTHSYTVPDVDLFYNDVSQAVKDSGISYDYEPPSNFLSLIVSFLPIIIMLGAMVFFFVYMNQQGGGKIGAFGKAKVREHNPNDKRTTFADVAGAEEEKEELVEIVEFLKNPSKYNALGAKIPKGVLLVGPPGTGKTLLARAVAGEAKVPFFSISGSDFVEMYVGVGASRVRDLFEKAKKQSPSIIFIDEIDAVGRQRGAGLGGGHDEREQTLNQLLVEMDGFEENIGVIIMAATNRADILDRALLRPGRFDRQIYVNYPDVKGREEILKVHARNKPLGPDVDLSVIAKSTPGFTGADLENLLNEAALLAARQGRKAITEADVEEATTKVMVGPEKKSKVITPRERKLTAYHEAGHAIVTHYAQPDHPVHQISIIPRGAAGGFTISLPNEDVSFHTKNEMQSQITTLLGGRVAEQLMLDDISTGASNDLERATTLARDMVTKYGFSEKLGPVVYSSSHEEVFLGRDFTQSRNYSEQVANDIDTEVRTTIEQSYNTARKLLKEHVDQLNAITDALLKYEKIDGETFRKIIENGVKPAESEPAE